MVQKMQFKYLVFYSAEILLKIKKFLDIGNLVKVFGLLIIFIKVKELQEPDIFYYYLLHIQMT